VTVENPTVSVVMAVRNGAVFLEEAVESVLAQTLRDLELIVVDDGSTDRTPEILAEFARADPRIRLVGPAAGGLSRALNLACAEARGQYLARLDADDVAIPDRLELQTVFLNAHPEVAVVGGAAILIDERGDVLGTVNYPADPAEVARVLASGRVPVMHPAATMRASAFRATSGYRRIVEGAEDYDLWLRISTQCRITNLPQPVLRYRLHEGQSSTKDVGRTATASAAGLAAARLRAKGEPDPLDEAETLDAPLLARLGVRPEDVAAQEVDYALWLARTLAAGGRHDRAAPFWSLSSARAAATADPRATRTRVLRARADACAHRRRRAHAFVLRARAAALERAPSRRSG
jgi:hypothetical protein